MPRYLHTEQSDALIRKAYATRSRKERRDYATRAAAMIGAGHTKAIYCRALAIGAVTPTQPQSKFWTPDEIQIVEDHAHLSPPAIRRKLQKAGFDRTPVAISIRVKRFHNGITQSRIDAGIYTATAAASLLGVHAREVCLWIKKGWLKARRSGLTDAEADTFEIRTADLRRFIADNAMRINGAKADMVWLIDLMTNRKADAAGH